MLRIRTNVIAFAALSSLVIAAACSISSNAPSTPIGVPSGNPNGADDGKACGVGNDCKSGVCMQTLCAVSTHSDGVRNGTETGLDCGGPGAPQCGGGQACTVARDCSANACVSGVCAGDAIVPRPDDGSKNGDETDIDCGGTIAPACTDGKACKTAPDCTSKVCAGGACAVPSPTDGLKNGDESDVDCGGTSAPACGVGKTCAAHADCVTDACDYKKTCITGHSCTAHDGGDSCGPGETDATHESCCSTAPIGSATLDKYTITSGRFRAFAERVNGNIRGWIQSHRPADFPAEYDAFLPTQMDDGTGAASHDGVYQELAPSLFFKDDLVGGNGGCFVSGNGTRTYRLPDGVNARMADPQLYSQEILDTKPLNCVSVFMVAAFCAWDDGRLPTVAELETAWSNGDAGSHKYPWGNAPAPAGYTTAYDSDATGATTSPANGDVHRANYFYNYWYPATRVGNDYSLYIAAPGRFPLGNGPLGHADLSGGLFNFTTIKPGGVMAAWSRSGSWQGHGIPYSAVGANPSFKTESKYWATGGRCAR